MKRKRLLALLAVILACVPGFGAGLSMDTIEAHAGMLTVGNYTSDNGLSPPIGIVGASTIFALDALPAPWALGLGVDLLGTWYEWDAANRRAFLSDYDPSTSFFTVGLIASPRFGVRFGRPDAVAFGAFLGLDLLFRFPLDPFSTGTTFAYDRLPALGYFFAGRFLYPGIGTWMTWQATKDVGLALSLRGLAPLYRAWSPETGNFLHQFVFAGTVGMTFKLKRAAAAEPATKPATP